MGRKRKAKRGAERRECAMKREEDIKEGSVTEQGESNLSSSDADQ